MVAMAVSLIGGEKWKYPKKTTDLLQVTDKLYLTSQTVGKDFK
jgi:hypothetical protein